MGEPVEFWQCTHPDLRMRIQVLDHVIRVAFYVFEDLPAGVTFADRLGELPGVQFDIEISEKDRAAIEKCKLRSIGPDLMGYRTAYVDADLIEQINAEG